MLLNCFQAICQIAQNLDVGVHSLHFDTQPHSKSHIHSPIHTHIQQCLAPHVSSRIPAVPMMQRSHSKTTLWTTIETRCSQSSQIHLWPAITTLSLVSYTGTPVYSLCVAFSCGEACNYMGCIFIVFGHVVSDSLVQLVPQAGLVGW